MSHNNKKLHLNVKSATIKVLDTSTSKAKISKPNRLSLDGQLGVSSKAKWILLVCSVLLIFITALMLTISDKINLSYPFIKYDDVSKPETYVSIGPVISSVDSGDLVRMSLDIGCKKMSYRKKITDLDTEIRNRVILVFQTPEAKELMAAGNYFALRTYVSKSVLEIIPDGMATGIYISDLLRY